jgi:hypothetical protein
MNERIVDLYEQASSFASEEQNPTKSYKDRVMIKFAELIVQECALIADAEKPNLIGCGYITKTNGMRIKAHFGVDN